MRLLAGMRLRLFKLRTQVETLSVRLRGQTPSHKLQRWRARLRDAHAGLGRAMSLRLERRGERLDRLAATLGAVGPVATLSRGYAIARTYPQGAIVHTTATVLTGQEVDVRLADGRLICRVERIETLD
jgi:exodeoxyribonuclease VII large subunit